MTVRLAEVTRNGRVESVHAGAIVVAKPGGEVVAWAGVPDTFAYFRSCAKPFQAIPLVESGAADAFGFTPAELALCCSSHNGDPAHQEAVLGMLCKLNLPVEALRCGVSIPGDEQEAANVQAGLVAPSPLQCDCSGKHSGMLATCLHRGYPIDRYLDADHPLQCEMRTIMGEVCDVPPESLALGTDGCSLPTFGAPIAAFACAYTMLATASGVHGSALSRLGQAMVAFPENVAGSGNLVTDLMLISGGRIIAKSGAEGMICLASPKTELGIAIRVADGSFRSHPAIVFELLRTLNLLEAAQIEQLEALHPPTIHNHNGWEVGDIRPAFELTYA